MQDQYVHHQKNDRSIESICTICLTQVCREPTLVRVKECEDNHKCPGEPSEARRIHLLTGLS